MKKDVANAIGGGRRGMPRLHADMDKRLCISVTELAAMLGLSRNNTYDLVNQKQLPTIRIGKMILIPKVVIEEMLKK